MALGFVIFGVILGFVSAGGALVFGAGFGTAFLIYAGAGALGMALAVLVTLLRQGDAYGEGASLSGHPQVQ